jgi:phage shock protein E
MNRLTALALAVGMMATRLIAAEHTTDSLDVVKQNLSEKKAVLVDVRELREWNKGHLKDARLQPLSKLGKAAENPEAQAKLAGELPKDKIIYCHCARGARAQTAGDVLRELGYDVRPLAAGYEELCKQGFEAAEPDDTK